MEWKNVDIDGYPEDKEYVLIAYEFGVGIAQFIDGDWDSVGSNRKHFIFSKNTKFYTSAQPRYWMPLPDAPHER